MATLPSASVSISADAGALAGGTGYCTVLAAVAQNADSVPRVFSSAKALLDQHAYAPGVDYSAMHIEETGKPVLFVGMPIATAGTIGRQDASGVLGTSVVTVAAGTLGVLEEVNAQFIVDTGGTIGTTGIKARVSLDGGRSFKGVNLGTASSYTIPYVGLVLSFAAGTLLAGDVYKFSTTAPMWDSAGLTAARAALAAQQKPARSWLVAGDLANATFAGYVVTQGNAYRTANKRFTVARCSVKDRTPLASMARETVRMTGSPTITFAEVGGTGDTITRGSGSFVTDGFATGMVITVAGGVADTGHNNVTGAITNVSASVLTLDTADLFAEGPISGVSIVGSHGLVFATTTCTRSGGSWLADGFAVGDAVTFAGTASNNITVTITVLTATVMTFASGGSAETIGSRSVTCTKGQTMAAWVSAEDAAFASIDAAPVVNLALGRGFKQSPITGSLFRRSAAWADSIRSYQHDVHIPTWRKKDGPLAGWSLLDENGTIVEYDETTQGGALAGRFTCFRTWENGPSGCFIAQSLTRDTEGSLLALAHNVEVANVACTVVQTATENVVGDVLQLKADGTAKEDSLRKIELSVNTDLQIALMVEKVIGEGPRASMAVWRASRTDVLNVADATLTGLLELHVNGTIVHVNTVVKVS